MKKESLGKVMLGVFALSLVVATFAVVGRMAILVLGSATIFVGWVIIAVNLVTGHHPFSPLVESRDDR